MEAFRGFARLSWTIFPSRNSKEPPFQRFLAIDLKQAGVTLYQEVEIVLTYKGERVGSRRNDLVVEAPLDHRKAVIVLTVNALWRRSTLRNSNYTCIIWISVPCLSSFFLAMIGASRMYPTRKARRCFGRPFWWGIRVC